jgi:hypothetical protein
MPLPVAAYAPHGNAQLTFTVSGSTVTADPATGNPVASTETLEYLAAVKLSGPNWQKVEGADTTLYRCTGRLLFPAALDPRITNGSKAAAVINGYTGRFELTFDLDMDDAVYSTVRQSIQGTFRVVGGKQLPPPPPPAPEED